MRKRQTRRGYDPAPIRVDDVELPRDLSNLVEMLAENLHDLWAERRFSENWTFGPERDDNKKRHPCLVHYAQLPESEREYDRAMVVQTLKTIMKLGYEIRKNPSA